MNTTIMVITITPRNIHASEVQNILTKHGCIIKTRLGLHEASEVSCSERGLIILHINSTIEDASALVNELSGIEGITVNSMAI